MIDDKFARRDLLISEPAFWFGVGIYLLLCIATTSTFGGTPAPTRASVVQEVSGGGTIIFGPRLPSALYYLDGSSDSFQENRQRLGAVTLHSYSTFGSTLNSDRQNARNSISPVAFDSRRAELPQVQPVVTVTGADLPMSSSFRDSGLTAVQIAAGDGSAFASEMSPVPEPATWVAAGLLAGWLAWTRRRQFRQILSQTRRATWRSVRGQVFARRIVLRGSSQIIHPPVVSP